MTKKDYILIVASDAGMDFTYYDRKEDENLQPGDIEKAIAEGVVTVEDLAKAFLTGAGLCHD